MWFKCVMPGPSSSARDYTIVAAKEKGRQRWKKMSDYHWQARVEHAFFREIISQAIRFHIERLREHNEPVPEPYCTATVVDVAAVAG